MPAIFFCDRYASPHLLAHTVRSSLHTNMIRAMILPGLILCLFSSCSAPPTEPRVGEEMPSYTSTTLSGGEASLEELKGQVVLLNVWATWCLPCRDEIPALQHIYQSHSSRGLELIGVSIDGAGEAERIRSFASEYGITYPIWHDQQNRIGEDFRLIGVPATFLIDRDGMLRWRRFGPVDADDPTLDEALTEALEDT